MNIIQKIKIYFKLRKELKQRAYEKTKFENSDEPWVSIIGDAIDPKHGLKLDMDWNDAFVKYLRKNGVPGIRDEDVVGYWVTTLHQQLLTNGEDE